MNRIVKWLDGKKTYIAAFAMALLAAAHQTGLITDELFQSLQTLLGALAAAALRAGMKAK